MCVWSFIRMHFFHDDARTQLTVRGPFVTPQAASLLVDAALQRGSTDNLSVIVVQFMDGSVVVPAARSSAQVFRPRCECSLKAHCLFFFPVFFRLIIIVLHINDTHSIFTT